MEELERNLYHSSKAVVSWIRIRECWEIVNSSESCVKLLHRLRFSYKKTKLFLCEADKERQEIFIKELGVSKELLEAKGVIYFLDACHPQHNTRSPYAKKRSLSFLSILPNISRN
ncbi:MAG: winged helix-turn-helix domain-containing protein [Raineya sp.]|nr:winged helix-turn-helix domain-containing protein [Raineya sp.]